MVDSPWGRSCLSHSSHKGKEEWRATRKTKPLEGKAPGSTVLDMEPCRLRVPPLLKIHMERNFSMEAFVMISLLHEKERSLSSRKMGDVHGLLQSSFLLEANVQFSFLLESNVVSVNEAETMK